MHAVDHLRARRRPKATLRAAAISAALVLIAAPAGSAASQQAPRAKTRVLIVTGVDYPGHRWRQTAPIVARALGADPRLDARAIEDPHFLDSAALARYRAVVLHFMNWETPAPGPTARENLRRFVAGGGGLVLLHFACGAWQDWPEFRKLAGRVWDPKLRPHDPRGPFKVRILDKKHPVTRGLRDFMTDDELYTCLAGEAPIRVLAVARSKVDGKDYPMAFVLRYGQGRVFHTLLGHDVKAFSFPEVQKLLRRGTAWAAGLDPDEPSKNR
ncbi:MAG: ThuA domain-containing protein [Verrucomicrobia bacterium]|nr:ThuA domain-containing protein [Verrucomicrobiota bacterium]